MLKIKVNCAYDKLIAIEDLKPNPKNPNQHPKKQIKMLAEIIKFQGWRAPITVSNLSGMIVRGHGRLEAAQLLKIKKCPVDFQDYGSVAEEWGDLVADNKIAELAEFDENLLTDLLKEIKDVDFDIKLTGFTEDELDNLFGDEKRGLTDDDAVPDVPKKPKTKIGNLYILGEHRLLCGDTRKKGDVEKLMNGKKANVVFTDPPYGMFLDTDFSGMVGIGKGNKYKKVIGDNEDFLPDLILKPLEFFNYCKEIFLWGADYYAEILPNKNKGSWIVWDKMQSGEGVNDNYDKMFGSNFELCWSKNKHKRAIVRVLWKGIFGLNKEPEKKRFHPNQKPIELAIWFLKLFSRKEQLIIDVYLGSGSTLITCEKINRTCYGMEIDPKYCDVIVKRWEDYTGKKAKLIR